MLSDGDSWVTIAEITAYFSKKYNCTFWAGLDSTEQEQLACTSKNFILSMGYVITDTDTTMKVKKAQYETIQFLYESYDSWKKRALLSAGGVKNFNVLNFSETLGEQKLPIYIGNLISDYYDNSSVSIGVIDREINS
jgi:hypothetical protein